MHLLRAAVCLGASVAAVQGTRIDHRGPREASSASLPEDDNTRSTFHSRRAVGAVSSLSPGLRKRSPTRPTSPHFNRDYWETWWEEHPDKLPDKGPDIQACFNNLKDYVRSKGHLDGRRDNYLLSKCWEMHGMTQARRPSWAKALVRTRRNSNLVPRSTDKSRPQEGASPGDAQSSAPLPTNVDGSPRFGRPYWDMYFERHQDEMPDKGVSVKECIANLKAFMVEKGDVDNRRDQYIKSICLSLHGQTRRRSHQARPDEAQQLWPTIPSAQNPGSKPVSAGNINNGEELRLQEDPSLRDPWLPMKSDGTPRFSAVYWNEYFKLYPDKIPRRGDTMEECKAILDAFLREAGHNDGRHHFYVEARCRDQFGIPWQPPPGTSKGSSDEAQDPAGESGSTPTSDDDIYSGQEELGELSEGPSGDPRRWGGHHGFFDRWYSAFPAIRRYFWEQPPSRGTPAPGAAARNSGWASLWRGGGFVPRRAF